jgi:ABC-type transporter Mla subunit MlaD
MSGMTKRERERLIKRIETERLRVAQRRDALREVLDDLESLHDTCAEAEDCLQRAIDALSEYA